MRAQKKNRASKKDTIFLDITQVFVLRMLGRNMDSKGDSDKTSSGNYEQSIGN